MWNRFFLYRILPACMVVALAACFQGGVRQKAGEVSRGIVVSPLSVDAPNPRALLLVNSLAIGKPEFRGVVNSSASEDGLHAVLVEVAQETLSLKVIDGQKARSGSGLEAADGVLRTEIVTMDDLMGSTVGGDPARVAFRMGVYQRGDSRPLWAANYVYSQEPMADNWLKLGDRIGRQGSGAGWLTAQEIFKRGVRQSLQDFNQRRDSQFQSTARAR